jgi:hypothetical protein
VSGLALEAGALEFERAVEVQACAAGDLHAITTDCALHVFPGLRKQKRKMRSKTAHGLRDV